MSKIGLITMMINKDFQSIGIYETLRKVREIGFQVIELSQLDMSDENIAELKRASKDFGIDIPVISASLEPMPRPAAPPAGSAPPADAPKMPIMRPYTLAENFDEIVGHCKELGATIIRIGALPLQYAVSGEKYAEFAKKAGEMATKLADHGIKLYYHNHNWEFANFDGKSGLDIIYDNSGPLGFEIDVHWAWRGGVDPVGLIRKYNGRVDLIHLKDYRVAQPDMEVMKSGDIRKIFGSLQNLVQFAEVGEGTLDFKSIIDTSLECNAKYFFIEQDDTYGRDIMESLQISADNLRKLGYGHLI